MPKSRWDSLSFAIQEKCLNDLGDLAPSVGSPSSQKKIILLLCIIWFYPVRVSGLVNWSGLIDHLDLNPAETLWWSCGLTQQSGFKKRLTWRSFSVLSLALMWQICGVRSWTSIRAVAPAGTLGSTKHRSTCLQESAWDQPKEYFVKWLFWSSFFSNSWWPLLAHSEAVDFLHMRLLVKYILVWNIRSQVIPHLVVLQQLISFISGSASQER